MNLIYSQNLKLEHIVNIPPYLNSHIIMENETLDSGFL